MLNVSYEEQRKYLLEQLERVLFVAAQIGDQYKIQFQDGKFIASFILKNETELSMPISETILPQALRISIKEGKILWLSYFSQTSFYRVILQSKEELEMVEKSHLEEAFFCLEKKLK